MHLDLLSIPQSGGKNVLLCCVLHNIINRSGLSHYPVIYLVVGGCQSDTVRGLLDRKRSEEHLQSSNESTKTKN